MLKLYTTVEIIKTKPVLRDRQYSYPQAQPLVQQDHHIAASNHLSAASTRNNIS